MKIKSILPLIFIFILMLITSCSSLNTSDDSIIENTEYDSSDVQLVENSTQIDTFTTDDSVIENTESDCIEDSEDSIESNYSFEIDIPIDTFPTAPEFLNSDLQKLYREAHALFRLLNFDIGDGWEIGEPVLTHIETNEIESMTYVGSNGIYQNWNDFEYMIKSVFTDSYFDSLLLPWIVGFPKFKNIDGKLYYIPYTWGEEVDYRGANTDTFELLYETENEIAFNVIGHFDYYMESCERFYIVREKDLNEGDSYTVEYFCKIIKTDMGYRFSDFRYSGTAYGNKK